MKILAAISFVALTFSSLLKAEDVPLFSKLAKFDEKAITDLCKAAIGKAYPKVDLDDLQLHQVEFVRNVKGADVGFPIELKAHFLLSSTRKVSKNSKGNTWSIEYSAVVVNIDPGGRADKCIVSGYGMGFSADRDPNQGAEQGAALNP